MRVKPFLSHILDDEGLTRGLGDPEARVLVEWLVERTEQLAATTASEGTVWVEVKRLCQRARAIARFVVLWGTPRARGAAVQLAGAERFDWPLPTAKIDPCELMMSILHWESTHPPPQRSAA